MYPALAVILLAVAACSARAAQGFRRSGASGEQLRGFLYVGAIALVLLAVAVVVVGIRDDRHAQAEGLAMFGLFTYALYLLAAWALARLSRRR